MNEYLRTDFEFFGCALKADSTGGIPWNIFGFCGMWNSQKNKKSVLLPKKNNFNFKKDEIQLKLS